MFLKGTSGGKSEAVELTVQAVVSRLTNWQRNQWARAGYPGQRDDDPLKVLPFAEMVRP